MSSKLKQAPELDIQKWLGTDVELSLDRLRCKIVVMYAFQILCPGCIEYSIPQAKQVHVMFAGEDLAVIGLHSVVEHHEGMQEPSLKAFLHEYKVSFPVGIDLSSNDAKDPIVKDTSVSRKWDMKVI